MGGFGSGRYGGGPTAESAFRIDIDALRRDGLIRFGVRAGCVIGFSGPMTTSKWNAKPISVVPGTLAHAGFEFHRDLVAVEIEPHLAGETNEGANPSPFHHVINVEPHRALDRRSSTISSAAKSTHLADSA
jgi:hypothetical protein